MGVRRLSISVSGALLGSLLVVNCGGGGGSGRLQELNCTDGQDQDMDGLIDCADPDCVGTAACGGPVDGGSGNVESDCTNGIDDDNDGYTDCDDSNCANLPVCGGTLGGDCATNAQTLAVPSDVRSGELTAADPAISERGSGYYTDAYVFTAAAGTAATFEITQGDFDTYIYLLDENCTELDHDDDGGSTGLLSGLTYTFNTTGTYVLQVTSFSSSATGTYTLTVSPATPSATTETDCSNGIDDDSDGYTDCNDADCEGSSVCGEPEDCTDGVDNDLDGYTDCDDSDCASTTACTALSCVTGVCLCNPVTGFSATAGTVAGSLSTTDPTEGNPRSSSYYYDAYEFAGTAGQSVHFELTQGDFDTYMYLLGPDCSTEYSNDDGGSGLLSLISTTLASSGTYTLVVTSYGSATGAYTLVAGGA